MKTLKSMVTGMVKGILPFYFLTLLPFNATAQNIQVHYDFGRNIYTGEEAGRQKVTITLEQVKADNGERFTIKQMERTKKGLEARLEKLQADYKKDDVVTFEQLGVDRLYVDESHAYKNCAKRCA